MGQFGVIIPAVKKSVAFTDDLVKKLDGISLIQRAIDKAKQLAPAARVHLITDSEEIRLVGERNAVRVYYNRDLRLRGRDFVAGLRPMLLEVARQYPALVLLHPYTPLVGAEVIVDAWRTFRRRGCDILLSVKQEPHRAYRQADASLESMLLDAAGEQLLTEVRAFQILRSEVLTGAVGQPRLHAYHLNHDAVEIGCYQDWWICEKLARRRRIVFRIIGDAQVGMGHIYRALALAHEITDHEIIFACD